MNRKSAFELGMTEIAVIIFIALALIIIVMLLISLASPVSEQAWGWAQRSSAGGLPS